MSHIVLNLTPPPLACQMNESTNNQNQNNNYIAKKNGFFVCGLTGGPYFPIPAITHNLSQITPVLIGVKNSFESKIAQSQNLSIEFLPVAKLDFLSFRSRDLGYILTGIFKFIQTVFLVIYSFFKSIQLLLKYQPAIIYSTGAFLAVPIIFAARLTNWLDWTNALIVIHQQDPQPGLTNRLTIKSADITSCVFEYTRLNYPKFKNCQVIPNPILSKNYSTDSKLKDRNLELFINRVDLDNEYHQSANIQTEFKPKDLSDLPASLRVLHAANQPQKVTNTFEIKNNLTKPLLLVFGGGSGANQINSWVESNFEQLVEKFRIIHLTGTINGKIIDQKHSDYYQSEAIFEDMPKVLARAKVVICRAGLGSISELQFLQNQSEQKAFLVPLPNSHQELNAELVKNNFLILDNSNPNTWLEQINQELDLPKFNEKTNHFDQKVLNQYYDKLNYEIGRLY
jgi:UDP-N-acetylglucosamine:LPS N-acetylglucosamine transferase